MKPARRNFLMGLVVVAIAAALSLLLAEIGLRMFTRFPVSYLTNLIHDPKFGYRLSSSLNDVDKNGFRNFAVDLPP